MAEKSYPSPIINISNKNISNKNIIFDTPNIISTNDKVSTSILSTNDFKHYSNTNGHKISTTHKPNLNQSFSMVVFNCQSIVPKVTELGGVITSFNPDIVVGTET